MPVHEHGANRIGQRRNLELLVLSEMPLRHTVDLLEGSVGEIMAYFPRKRAEEIPTHTPCVSSYTERRTCGI